MFPEQSSLLTSLLSRFRREKRKGRRGPGRASPFDHRSVVEVLEERRLLVSRVFLDFGDGFTTIPTTGPFAGLQILNTNTGAMHDALVGTGASTRFPASSLTETLAGGAIVPGGTGAYTMVAFSNLINFGLVNQTVVPTDFFTLEVSITEQIRQALEPFDIQVISSAENNIFNFPVANNLNRASALLANNNLPGDGGSPVDGTAAVPQYGSDDVYIFMCGLFTTVTIATVTYAQPVFLPMSSDFAVMVPNSPGGKPDRLDSGAVIDANYWIDRVLGQPSSPPFPPLSPATPVIVGTGGSLNVALANAALYSIGWDYGLSEIENGTVGPNTNFFDPNIALLNQANAMVEGGATESFLTAAATVSQPINDQRAAYFTRFNMMQDGEDLHQLLTGGTLGNPPILATNPAFPLPPPGFPFYVYPDTTINEDPNVTVNTYDQLVNDPDIGPSPDVAYVTGTGAFDQITITKLNATQASVTVNAFDDNTYTNLIGSTSYTINLTKIVTPGRLNDSQPFRVIVEGCNSDDEIFLDPTLGVNVVVHGGPDVKMLNITGNGLYDVQYTPAAPPGPNNLLGVIPSLIPEGLIPGAAGTFVITGTTPTTVFVKVGNRLVARTVATPFTTTVGVDHFNPTAPDPLNPEYVSAVQLDNFNKLTYKSPGFVNNDYLITSLISGAWQITGQEVSGFFPPLPNGNVRIINTKQLAFDTTKGASSDTIAFNTANALPPGLQSVSVAMGTGFDELDFDDSASILNQNYIITPSLLLPTQPAVSPFHGFTYSGVELLVLEATQGNNSIVVTPSATTAMIVNGNDPPDGTLPPDGDRLAVHVAGTTGAAEFDDGVGNGEWTFDNRQPITFSGIEDIAQPVNGVLALAAGAGNAGKPLVRVEDAVTHALLYSFYAFPLAFKGGVQVATADVDGDGTPDVIVAPGIGRAGEVKVYSGAVLQAAANAQHFVADPDGSGALLADFFPEGPAYLGGLNIATGDVDFDGNIDIITSRARGPSMVRVFQNTGGAVFVNGAAWQPYPKGFGSGVVVTSGDTDGDGTWEVITAPGVGSVALVKVFDGTTGRWCASLTDLKPRSEMAWHQFPQAIWTAMARPRSFWGPVKAENRACGSSMLRPET